MEICPPPLGTQASADSIAMVSTRTLSTSVTRGIPNIRFKKTFSVLLSDVIEKGKFPSAIRIFEL
jgi:hypothetical protein